MSIFITGGTGFLGGYVLAALRRDHPDTRVFLLTRAQSEQQAHEKLWRALQLHMDRDTFWDFTQRVTYCYGDLHAPRLGLSDEHYAKAVTESDSLLHIAASLNRRSAKVCFNTNLRGTLSVIKLARAMHDDHGLRRFSQVSTTAVAGQRNKETVFEDTSIDWDRSDYDPYARTKKFAEHMVAELLPDVPRTVFRPPIVMGDSRQAATTQFDMVRAFCFFADLPFLPWRADARLDITSADFVGDAIAALHMKAEPEHPIYHLSAGLASPTSKQVVEALVSQAGTRPPRFAPGLYGSFERLVDTVARSKRRNMVTWVATLLDVFLPYITFDTVFDNTRVTQELGRTPTPFTSYCGELYNFAKKVSYKYPYEPLETT